MSARIATVVVFLLLAGVCMAGNTPVGSLTAGSNATVSGIQVPNGTAVFRGDVVETTSNNVVFTTLRGDSILLSPNSSIRLGESQVELLKGVSQVTSGGRNLTLLASNWSLKATPDSKTGRVAATVVRDADGSVSLTVREGEIRAQDVKTKAVQTVAAGRPTLLPAAALPPPQANPPASTGRSNAKVIGAYALALAAIATGAAAIATRDEGVGREEFLALQTQNQQLASQLAALASQNAALATQVAALQTRTNTLIAALQEQAKFNAQAAASLEQLLSISSQMASLQAQLATVNAQVTALLQILGSGQTLTAAQQAELASLLQQQTTLNNQFLTVQSQLNQVLTSFPNPPTTPSIP